MFKKCHRDVYYAPEHPDCKHSPMTFPLSLHLKKIESSVTFVPITGSAMSVNDYCRFCKINLRIQGILSHTRPIFQEKPTGRNGNIVSQCSKLGLTLHNTPLRSNRACGKCYTIITRMVRNIDRLNGWRKRESQKICDGEGANLPSSTLPLSSPASMEKPSRSSVTEVSMIHGCLCYQASSSTRARQKKLPVDRQYLMSTN